MLHIACRSTLLTAACVLAGCGAVVPPPETAFVPASAPPRQSGKVVGMESRGLIARFGQPRLDVRDGPARKLQFTGARCILDLFLYAPSPGKEPVVTYAEARTSAGVDVDADGCARSISSR